MEKRKCIVCDQEAKWLDRNAGIAFCEKHKTFYNYEYQPHITPKNRLSGLLKQCQKIMADLQKLVQWENQGKIRLENILDCSIPIYQIALDDFSIEDEFLKVVTARRWEKDEYDNAGIDFIRL